MALYSENTLDSIRERLDIVEVISEYVELKKSGQGFLGLCPFHGEKTASFHVHPSKQCFHCFGCHKGGNVFTFISSIEGLSFPQTVQKLAKRVGVELETVAAPRMQKPSPVVAGKERLTAALDWATKYFHYLLNESKEYAYAKKYITDRGITQKTIDKFRIGVSPKGWSTLLTLMTKRGFTLQELNDAGLIVPKEGNHNGGYDRFRGRLMFPILDLEGNTIAFGGRLLADEENQPKYINSNESPLFSKRRNLYGLYENQRVIRLKGEAVVVEGYMDVVGLYEAGVHNAVATMGTALTEDHCLQLKNITQRVVTVFDPDAAGQDAWHRSVHLFMEAGIFAKDLTLPGGQDPDEFVLEQGAEAFYQLCEKAPQQTTKLLKEIAGKKAQTEQEVGKALELVTPILKASRRLNPKERYVIWDDISLTLGISLEALKEIAEGGYRNPKADETKQAARPNPNSVNRNRPPTAKHLGIHPVDLEFFQAAVRWPELFLKTPPEKWKGALEDRTLEAFLEKLCEAADRQVFENILEQMVHHGGNPVITAAAASGLFPATAEKDAEPLFQALLQRLSRRKTEKEIKALSAQVRLTQRLGDDKEQLRLLERLKELRSS